MSSRGEREQPIAVHFGETGLKQAPDQEKSQKADTKAGVNQERAYLPVQR